MAGHILFVVVPDVELIAGNMGAPLSRVSAIKMISVDARMDGDQRTHSSQHCLLSGLGHFHGSVKTADVQPSIYGQVPTRSKLTCVIVSP
jgi:hypothetical protein